MLPFKTRILSTGVHYPENIVTNKDLESIMETSDEWIQSRSGIKERRWVKPGDGNTVLSMAVSAAKMALTRANLQADDLDAIIFGCLFSDYIFPSTGSMIQHELGCSHPIPALDIRNACSGFLYALSVADSWIRCGVYKRVLIVASEIHSTSLDKTTRGRDVSVLFGDAAGAVIVEAIPGESQNGVLDTIICSEGKLSDRLILPKPTPNDHPRLNPELGLGTEIYPRMDGKTIFKNAVTRMPEVVRAIVDKNKLKMSDVDFLIPHQANLRINEFVCEHLGLKPNQTHVTIDRFGNTTMATIPLTLHEALEQQKIKKGDLLALTAFGAGLTWGASLIRMD